MEKTLARLYLLITILSLVVVLLGSFVRSSGAGLSCPDWPLCFGAVVPNRETFANTSGIHQEYIHRALAGLLGILVLVAALLSFAWRASQPKLWRASLALLGLVIVQALFGGFTVLYKLEPLIVVSHLVLGTIFFQSAGFIWASFRFKDGAQNGHAKAANFMRFLAGFVLLQMALGAYVAATHSGLSCPSFPICSQIFNPGILHDQQVTLAWHGLVGVVLLSGVFFHLPRIKDLPQRKRLLGELGGMFLIQVLLGFAAVAMRVPYQLTLLHLFVAQLILFRLVRLWLQFKPSARLITV